MSAHDARDDPARYGSVEGGVCESDGRVGIGAGDMAGSLDLLAKAGMDGGRSSGVTSAEFEGDSTSRGLPRKMSTSSALQELRLVK